MEYFDSVRCSAQDGYVVCKKYVKVLVSMVTKEAWYVLTIQQVVQLNRKKKVIVVVVCST